ncbi:7331_t:CDS:1 [Entrophospora sp. SA101]|nr:7331_t:CDS:1 [Entrophospora sp. SA101]CAJ0827003.1 4608_t:CDS:1 [Entrophospora sp. SA101]
MVMTYCIQHNRSSERENSIHASYNQPPIDIIPLLMQHIEQFKNLLVNEIHKRFPLHYTKSGKQLIKFPCTDSEFVAIFGKQLNQFSPAKCIYQCIFKGYAAEAMLGELLGDKQWGTRYYEANQKSFVQLYLQENVVCENNSNQSLESYDISNIKTVTIVPPEMTVEWFQENIKDAKGHETSGGQLRIRFCLDQEYYG